MSNKPKKILNDASDAVDELIEGLLLQHPNRLVKLQNHHVLLNSTLQANRVQLLSGGGSGHEPSHAGWIGEGMLSGAILGGMFASPSVASILAAVRAVSRDKSCPVLLIVKNYTGDRLNFGMACEKANSDGIETAMVVVADDTALERTKGITGARGVAGTVLVHKVAGAAAASGKTLEQVVQLAKATAAHMGTLGVALDAVTVPGADTVNDRLSDFNKIEIGLGIHGEAGMRQSPLLKANDMAEEMVSTIQNYGRVNEDGSIVPLLNKGDDLAVLVNNLGGTSNFEMSILTRSVVDTLEKKYECTATRVLVGSFMTSFDMHGASVTLLNLSTVDPVVVTLLDAETNALSWSSCDVWDKGSGARPSLAEVPEVVVDESKGTTDDLPVLEIENFAALATSMVTAAAKALAEAEPLLTKYDTIVGDGDCGITMKRGATEVLQRLDDTTLNIQHPVTLFSSLAEAVSASMGGTSGVLLELMFTKMSTSLARVDGNIGVEQMCRAFSDGVEAVSLYGGATVGSRTMLDSLVPAAEHFVASGSLVEAARKAREGADGTAELRAASAGRSNYLSEETLQGTPDPGAVATATVLEALCKEE